MKGRASTWGENRLHSRICRAKHRVLAMMAASFTSSEKPSEMHNRYRPTMAMAMPIHTRREVFFPEQQQVQHRHQCDVGGFDEAGLGGVGHMETDLYQHRTAPVGKAGSQGRQPEASAVPPLHLLAGLQSGESLAAAHIEKTRAAGTERPDSTAGR